MEIKKSAKGDRQSALWALLVGVMGGVLLLVNVVTDNFGGIKFTAISATFVVGGVVGALYFFIKSLRSKPMYVIDVTGITFNDFKGGPVRVPWVAIDHFDIVYWGIDVGLVNEAAFCATLSPRDQVDISKRRSAHSNYMIFIIATPFTTSKLEDVLRTIQSYTNKPINNVVGVILEY
jgi:hypothetical protein